MTYLSETPHFPSSGNTQDGISLCYGACLTDIQLLVTIRYMAYGTSELCSKVLVVPHPAAQTVEATDCPTGPVRTFVRDLYLQTVGGGCGCPDAHAFPGIPQPFDCAVAVEKTTWGAIKALYRD